MKPNNNYGVILAGGKGCRLWPCSRESKPKQFIDFFGTGRTQLQQTYDLLLEILPLENIFISTSIEYLHFVREQLPQIPTHHIIAAPIHRNTAPSVAWAVHRIMHENSEASVVVVPSDQSVFNKEVFRQNILDGFSFVSGNDAILTIGVRPTREETGYGYIQKAGSEEEKNIFKVQTFTEKPDADFAKVFVDSGEWVWNTGMFVANTSFLRSCLELYLPPVLREFDEQHPVYSVAEEDTYMQEHFRIYPHISLDSGVFEKSENVYVMECSFGWADLGTWHGIYESVERNENDNVVLDSNVLMEDAHNNIIKVPRGRLAVIQGLEGYVIAEEGNVLLICKKEGSSSLIRKFVNEIRMHQGEEFV